MQRDLRIGDRLPGPLPPAVRLRSAEGYLLKVDGLRVREPSKESADCLLAYIMETRHAK